ncbi:MAG: hypothetical protein AAFZ65_04300 [Planctomycetota bacterium]
MYCLNLVVLAVALLVVSGLVAHSQGRPLAQGRPLGPRVLWCIASSLLPLSPVGLVALAVYLLTLGVPALAGLTGMGAMVATPAVLRIHAYAWRSTRVWAKGLHSPSPDD